MRSLYLVGLFVLGCWFSAVAQHAGRKDFTQNWQFKLDSAADLATVQNSGKSWRTLNLPHDWSIEGDFSEGHPATPGGGALPGGIGWYRKTFSLPMASKGKAVFIDFDGVYRNSDVWINGQHLGRRPNGYISFQYELTPYLYYGTRENVLVVKVDNSGQPNSRWYSGSGIYRNVWLTTLDKVHVDHWGTFITTPTVTARSAVVTLKTNISNQSAVKQPLVLTTVVYDASGKVVKKDTVRGAGEPGTIVPLRQSFTLERPHLWSTADPYLYKVVSEVRVNEKLVDTYQTPLGVRSFSFDADKGFSLNGKPMKILGVCNHHDLGALGTAINTRALQRQLELLKAMGCNGIRTSHNPPVPELLSLCDQMGFIVMDEAFDMWAKSKTKYDYSHDWEAWHKQDLQDQVRRDRNHPSVFIWSVGNEIMEQWGDEKKGDTSGRGIARELVALVKDLDTSRPVVTANNETGLWNNIIKSGAFDLIGYNYHHSAWADFHQRWPGKKLIVTESTSALQTRGYYDLVPADTIRRWPEAWDKPVKGNADFTVSAYDHVSAPWGSTHEESIKALLKSDVVSGMYIWTGFDYLGEPTPYSWPARSSYFGIIDLAGFPKDVYYLYQSVFTDKPVLHLLPHWNWKAGDTVDVVAYYSKADEAELFVNGHSLGKRQKQGDDLHVHWRVPYEPGTLKAVTRQGGNKVLSSEVKTAGAPAKIILKADRSLIKADGKDLSYITGSIVDKNGVVVPNAGNLVQFSISGEGFIAGVDNGSPTSHESFKAGQHTALNGLVLAIVQSNGKSGKITLTARGDGLLPATVVLEAR